MRIYDFQLAPNPRRLRIFLAEKGINLETLQLNLRKGEQFSPEYQAKNPLCDVPMLELDNGICISQVNAICRYFEELHPEPSLFGSDPEEKAIVEMWNHIVFNTGMMAVADAYRNSSEFFENRAEVGPHNYEQIPALAERGLLKIQHFFKGMNLRLTNNKYIAGNNFSVADITVFVAIDFAKRVEAFVPETLGHLNAWYNEMSQRASASA